MLVLSAPMAVLAQFDQTAGGKTNLPGGSVMDIIENIMYWLLALVGIIGVIGFAIAGILYLTSAGDETRIEGAKKAMAYAILGVVVAIVGLVAVKAVATMLGGTSTTF